MVKDEVSLDSGGQEFESATNEGSEQKSSPVDNADLEPEQFRKLFIGGLAAATNEDSLREFYEKWGTVIDVVVMRDPQTKRSRGFGFVSYANQKEVDESMNNRPHVVDGKTVDPKRAVPREQSSRNEPNVSSKRLYVSGVREDHTEDIFTDYFGTYGKVEKCEVIMDKNTGKPRGFAFITFDDHDSVDKCVLIKSHMITGHRCDVKKALSKDDMNRAQGDRDRGGRFDRGGRGGGRMGPGGPGRDAWGGARGGYGGGPQGGGSGYGGGWGGSQQAGWGGQQGGGWGGQGGGWGGQQQGGGGWGGQQGGGYGASYGGGYGGGQQGGWGQGAQQGGGYGGGQQQGGWGGQQQQQGGGQGQGGWGRGY